MRIDRPFLYQLFLPAFAGVLSATLPVFAESESGDSPAKTTVAESGDLENAISEPPPGGFNFFLPAWMVGLEGTLGVRGLETGIDAGFFSDILPNADMLALGGLEARRGKLGFIIQGLYVNASVDGTPPGPLLSNLDVGVKLVLAEGTVAWRVFENDRAWLDLIGGARYIYLGADMGLRVDSAGVRQFSEDLSAGIVDRAAQAARDEVDRRLPAIKADLRSRVTSIVQTKVDRARGRLEGIVDDARMEIEDRVVERVDELRGAIGGRIGDGIGFDRPGILPRERERPGILPGGERRGERRDERRDNIGGRTGFERPDIGGRIADRLKDALRDYAMAEAEARVAAARSEAAAAQAATRDKLDRRLSAAKRKARQKAEQRVAATEARIRKEADKALDRAEAKLAKAIEDEIEDRLPKESVSGSHEWVDPFIGLRGRCDLSEDWYLAVQGDIGGFGINSDLTWNLFGALGYQITDRASIELGYRYYRVDYRDGGFVFDMAAKGPFLGVGIEF